MTALLAWLLLRLAPKAGPEVRIIPPKPQGFPPGHLHRYPPLGAPSPSNTQQL